MDHRTGGKCFIHGPKHHNSLKVQWKTNRVCGFFTTYLKTIASESCGLLYDDVFPNQKDIGFVLTHSNIFKHKHTNH